MGRRLVKNVVVDGVAYGPDCVQDVPAEVAARIADHAWESDEPVSEPVEGAEAPVRQRGGRRRAPENDS